MREREREEEEEEKHAFYAVVNELNHYVEDNTIEVVFSFFLKCQKTKRSMNEVK